MAGGFVGVFSLISTFMGADNLWVDITLDKLAQGALDGMIEAVPFGGVQNGLFFVVHQAPLSMVIMALGACLLVAGMFRKV